MVFSQIMDFASQDVFKNIVSRYKGNYKTKDFSSWKHFLCLSFGQLTHHAVKTPIAYSEDFC